MKQALILILFFIGCNGKDFDPKWIEEKAPDKFSIRFETSKGSFDAQITRELSPMAVDRFYQLIRHDYFDNALFYRVVPGYVAQFGNSDSSQIKNWIKYIVPDEPVIGRNTRGTISFARDGKDTRNTELYINLQDNLKLDTINYSGVKGFPVIGEVTNGMNVVDSLYQGHGNSVFDNFDLFYLNRKEFLNQFPGLDSILHIRIIKSI